MATTRICTIPDCGKKHFGRGWCNAHYSRWRDHGDPLGGGRPLSSRGEPLQWMQEHLDYDESGCLIWPFARHQNGYGALTEGGEKFLAHRWACEQVNGPPPSPRHEAAHACGRGKQGCVNPRHLRWATKVENEADKAAHGSVKGSRNPRAQLTEDQVLEIFGRPRPRTRYEAEAVAAVYGVAWNVVRDIFNGRNWAWLTGAK